MSALASSGASSASEDPSLGHLLEVVVEQLQSGQAVDVEELVRQHPQHEARLRRLLSTMQAMAQLAGAKGSGDGIASHAASGTGQSWSLGEFRILHQGGWRQSAAMPQRPSAGASLRSAASHPVASHPVASHPVASHPVPRHALLCHCKTSRRPSNWRASPSAAPWRDWALRRPRRCWTTPHLSGIVHRDCVRMVEQRCDNFQHAGRLPEQSPAHLRDDRPTAR